ncbi:MAG: thermonuclease family protein [Thermodesulfovibrionales bacterium]|nr:thermonuclease family protein [Thermodesulfovibrionales bacterium]
MIFRAYYNRLIVFIIVFLFINLPIQSSANTAMFRVTEVHDGDTVSIRTSSFWGLFVKTEKVRLIGIDAPELNQEPWGKRAKRHLKKLISENDWIVRVEYDIMQRDRYDRILAYLWGKNNTLINEQMLLDGYAVLYTVPPNVRYVDKFTKAQKIAQQQKRGIWGKQGLSMTPEEWRRKHNR